MTERVLGSGMRLLLGLLGVAAIGAALLVAAAALRAAPTGAPQPARWALAAVAAVVALGGARLVHGAVRGRITVRRPRHRPPLW